MGGGGGFVSFCFLFIVLLLSSFWPLEARKQSSIHRIHSL